MKMRSSRAKTELTPLTDFLIDKLTKDSAVLDLVRGQSANDNIDDVFQQDIDLDQEIDTLLDDPKAELLISKDQRQK
jgi:hypothetical protein